MVNRYSWYTNHVCIIVLGYWCLTSYFWPQPNLLIYVPGVSWPFLYNATAIGAVWLELWWWWSWWRWNKRSKMLWPCVVAVDPPPLHPVKVITSSPDFMATAQLHVAREEELHLAYLACTWMGWIVVLSRLFLLSKTHIYLKIRGFFFFIKRGVGLMTYLKW